jgi:hypothetical protein
MTMDSQDDSFVIFQDGEVSKSKYEALNHIRFGNNSLEKQFKRDIELISLAIVQCGQSEQDKIKADMLLKSMLLLFFGQLCYRHISDQRFYSFDTLNTYFKHSTLTHFPIAALLLHGSRVLIEFPIEMRLQLVDWLIIDKSSWRYLATHSISALTEAEVIPKNLKNTPVAYPVRKCLKEEKVSGAHAAINLLSSSISGLMANAYFSFSTPIYAQDKITIAEHYGIDLALGGVGNQHFSSEKIIQNNGEHGHLYINFYQGLAQKKQSGLLLGIEQSAPGKPDQYGGAHDLSVSDKDYSASGGDFFCKKPTLLEVYQKDYRGLTVLPFANYYDSLWNFITENTFTLIKSNFEKCKCLLSLLEQEKGLAFIRHILAAPGGASQEDFDGLFDQYFQEIPQVKVKTNLPICSKDKLKTLQQHIQRLKVENEQLATNVKADFVSIEAEMQSGKNTIDKQSKELIVLRKRLQNLAIEKNNSEKNSQELSTEIIRLREQEVTLQNDNKTLLTNLAQSFMQCVINQMGWLAGKSQKKKILLALQQKTQTGKISAEQLTYLLKNFISVSLMNRYYFKAETHTAKACLARLSLPRYQSLAALLEIGKNVQYQGLLDLVSDSETKKEYFISAKYKKNLYDFYQKENSKENQLADDKLSLAMQRIVYVP